jgi:hypothetical protein
MSDKKAMATTIEELKTIIIKLCEETKSLRQEIVELKSNPQTTPFGCPPWYVEKLDETQKKLAADPTASSLMYSSFLINESVKAIKKSFNAVIEGLADIPDRTVTKVENDAKFVADICARGQLAAAVECWRQPSKNPNRPRVVKVRFLTVTDRDNFIVNFRKLCPVFSARAPSCRRDMTVPELQLLYSNRQSCREANIKCGQFKYYTRDLKIVEMKVPQPLRG